LRSGVADSTTAWLTLAGLLKHLALFSEPYGIAPGFVDIVQCALHQIKMKFGMAFCARPVSVGANSDYGSVNATNVDGSACGTRLWPRRAELPRQERETSCCIDRGNLAKSVPAMPASKTNEVMGRGSALGAIATLAAAVAVAYLVPDGKENKGGQDRAGGFASRHGSNGGISVGETHEPGRGRHASAPSEIPARGWKDILLRVYRNISDHRVFALAAGMTFYSLLAIFPALAALVAIYGLFSDPAAMKAHLDQVSEFMPSGAIDVARDQLTRVASKGSQTLGFTFAFGLAVSLWSANAAMKSLFDTLNIVYAEQEKRSFIKLNAISLTFTAAAVAFILVAIAAVAVLPIALEFVGLTTFMDLLLRIARWPALFIVLTIALALIYRFGPSREAPKLRWITWGSALSALLWLAASGLFSFYAANFGNFDATYGSLGAVIGFMTWMWISAITVLIGAELNAEMEHQTARDTTTGHPKRLGARGAKMADTVGATQG
jgi:membrane protein